MITGAENATGAGNNTMQRVLSNNVQHVDSAEWGVIVSVILGEQNTGHLTLEHQSILSNLNFAVYS